MLRVILVDDEPLARKGLRQLLAAHPHVTVAGEASNVEAARGLIAEHRPDAIFLDVRMPGADGFSLLEGNGATGPKVVFITAHAEHAVRAFEVDALDYLLKPVRPERLAMALRRLGAACAANNAPLGMGDRLCLRTPQRTIVTPLDAVAALEADGDFTRFFVRGSKPLLICHSLGSYETMLPAPPFVRLDRSLIVNVRLIAGLDRRSRDEARLVFEHVEGSVILGRTAQGRLREVLGV